MNTYGKRFQSLFYWITYSYAAISLSKSNASLLVSILILLDYLFLSRRFRSLRRRRNVSILILLDYLFLSSILICLLVFSLSFNPYFIGLPILIRKHALDNYSKDSSFNPYFIGLPILIILISCFNSSSSAVSILILLDYLFLYSSGKITFYFVN